VESARQAEAFLAARGRDLRSATRADLEDFLADLLARRSASTAATRHKGLRILHRWLAEEDEITRNPMARIRAPIVPEQPVPVVPEDGLRHLLAACAGKDFDAVLVLLRDRLSGVVDPEVFVGLLGISAVLTGLLRILGGVCRGGAVGRRWTLGGSCSAPWNSDSALCCC
jgi:hypothetical protein